MRLKSGLLYIFRSNIRLKTSKEKRQDEYYSKGKGMQEKYKDRLITLDLLPLCYDRETTNLMFFYKASHGNIDIDISNFVFFVNNSRTRSSQLKTLKTPHC